MTKIWTFIRHNPGMVVGSIICICVLVWTYGCESQVTSIVNPTVLVTRAELTVEVDAFLAQQQLKVDTFIAQANLKVSNLDRQDQIKNTIFTTAIDFMQGGKINPAAVALVIGNILGLGAIADNLKKRTHINTLKGANANAKEKDDTS